MTETCQNKSQISLQYVCRICLETEGSREMSYEEMEWYQCVCTARARAVAHSLLTPSKRWVCWVCAHLLRKYLQFLRQCQRAHDMLTQTSNIPLELSEKTHNFIHTKPTTTSIEPTLATVTESPTDIHVKLETFDTELDSLDFGNDAEQRSVSDDDLPLTVFKHDDNHKKKIKKKKKKAKKKSEATKPRSEIEDTGAGASASGGVTDKLTDPLPSELAAAPAPLREGFTSRMRQETDEYRVIKLTHDQVVSELVARSQEERYVRAPHKCARCVRAYNFHDVLLKHMDMHKPERGPFQCTMCSQYCPSAVSLRGHLKSHTTRYECKVCGCTRRCRQHLLEHFRSAHAAPRLYRCDHCIYTTTKRTVIQRHVRTMHRGAGPGEAGGGALPHACALCPRRFRTADALRVHTSRHDAEGGVRCGECGRRFVFESQLRAHTRSAHLRADYYCVECDARFGSEYNLQLHFKRAKRHREAASNSKIAS